MKQRLALLIALMIAATLCLGALVAQNAEAKPPAKDKFPPPPAEGISMVRGVLVKSEGGGLLTVVVTAASGGTPEARALLKTVDKLTLFRVSGPADGTDFSLGHQVEAYCHVMQSSNAPNPTDPDQPVAVAAVPAYGEKLMTSEEPQYKTMERILKNSISDEARSLTVDVLIGLPGKRSSQALAAAIYDISTEIRLKASRELVERQYEPVIEPLQALIADDIEDQLDYQIALAEILAGGGYRTGIAFLLRHLDDDQPATVLAVVRALGNTGGADEAGKLDNLAETTDDDDLAKAARKAARAIHDRLAAEAG